MREIDVSKLSDHELSDLLKLVIDETCRRLSGISEKDETLEAQQEELKVEEAAAGTETWGEGMSYGWSRSEVESSAGRSESTSSTTGYSTSRGRSTSKGKSQGESDT